MNFNQILTFVLIVLISQFFGHEMISFEEFTGNVIKEQKKMEESNDNLLLKIFFKKPYFNVRKQILNNLTKEMQLRNLTKEQLSDGLDKLIQWRNSYIDKFTQPGYILCHNGGTLTENKTCICPPGSSGIKCEVRLTTTKSPNVVPDNCDDEPCLNDGDCSENIVHIKKSAHLVVRRVQATCECRLGFIGTFCETKVLTCEDFDDVLPCRGDEICITENNGFKCVSLMKIKEDDKINRNLN